jgi:hypothetical protein
MSSFMISLSANVSINRIFGSYIQAEKFSIKKVKHLLIFFIEKANDTNDKFVASINSTIDQSGARVVEKGKKHKLMLTQSFFCKNQNDRRKTDTH